MKRFGFLAVSGAAALAAGFAVPAAAAVATPIKLPVMETDWVQSPNNAIWFKRYFVMNARGGLKSRPHLTNAMTIGVEEWFSPQRAEIQHTLDVLARRELREWIDDDVTYPNVCLFGGDMALPVQMHPTRP